MAERNRTVWPWVAAASSIFIYLRVGVLVVDYDSTETELTLMPIVATAVWLALGFYAALAATNRPSLQRNCALVTACAAAWLLLGSPDLDDGGQWFGFVLVYYLPLALIAVAVGFVSDRAKTRSLKAE